MGGQAELEAPRNGLDNSQTEALHDGKERGKLDPGQAHPPETEVAGSARPAGT